MTAKNILWNGVMATVYYMNEGDSLGWHMHKVDHNTTVIKGRTRVEVSTGFRAIVEETSEPLDLPANIPHDIIALCDNTIIVNMITVGGNPADSDPIYAARGGVALVDGSIDHENT